MNTIYAIHAFLVNIFTTVQGFIADQLAHPASFGYVLVLTGIVIGTWAITRSIFRYIHPRD